MTDLFPTVDPTPAPTNLFPQIDVEPLAPPSMSPEQQKTTATLATLAQNRHGLVDPTKTFDDQTQANQYRLSQNDEAVIQDQIARRASWAKDRAAQSISSDIVSGNLKLPDTEGGPTILDFIQRAMTPSQPEANAIEKEGVKQLQDTSKYSWLDQELLHNNYENLSKVAIFQKEVDKLQQEVGQQSYLRDLLDVFAIPGQNYVDKVFNIKTGGTAIPAPARGLQNQIGALWSLPLDQFEAALPGVVANIKSHSGLLMQNKRAVAASPFTLPAASDVQANTFTATTALDAASFVPIGKIAKWLRDPAAFSLAAGNREAAVNIDAAALTKAEGGPGTGNANVQDPVQAVKNAMPGQFKPTTQLDPGISTGADTVKTVNAYKIDQPTMNNISRLNPEQQAKAVADHVDTMLNKFNVPQDKIVDVRRTTGWFVADEAAEEPSQYLRAARPSEVPDTNPKAYELTTEPGTGLMKMHMYLGQSVGQGGFETAELAAQDAEDMGMKINQFQNVDKLWYNVVEDYVPENGSLSPRLDAENLPKINHVSALARSPLHFIGSIFAKARVTATINRAALETKVFNPILKKINAISGKSQAALERVMAAGEEAHTWYTSDELDAAWKEHTGRLPSDKEKIAYDAAKEASDAGYHIFNNNLHTDLARDGWNTVTINGRLKGTERQTGKISEPDWGKRVHDVETGGLGDTKKMKAKYDNGGYQYVELRRAIERKGEDPIKYVLVSKNDLAVEPLERFQLNYVGGGSRHNLGGGFIKQAVRRTFKDGGVYWKDPITHMVVDNAAQGEKVVKRLEDARRAWNTLQGGASEAGLARWVSEGGRDLGTSPEAELRQIIAKSPYGSYEKFAGAVKNDLVEVDAPFEYVEHAAQPRYMSRMKLASDVEFGTPEMTPQEQYYLDKGQMYYGKKGERLLNPEQKLARVLSPLKTLSEAIKVAMNTSAFGDYNRLVVDEWSRLARDLGAIEGVPTNADNYTTFFHGRISKSFERMDKETSQKLIENREAHFKFMNHQEEAMGFRAQMTRRFANWIDDKGKIGDWAATKALDSMSRNPTSSIRGFVFDPVLGMFDVGQLFVQTQTALAAMSVHPTYGLQTAAMLPVHMWMKVNRSENLLDYVAQNLKWLHGMEPSDFKVMVKMWHSSGWREVGAERQLLDHSTTGLGASMLARGYFKTIQKGRFFFNQAEVFNRHVGFNIAYRRMREEFPNMAVDSEEFRTGLNQLTDDLTANMTTAGKAAWQRGIPSIPTQFLAYQARMLESMLPKMFGGNPRFSAAQRARLTIGQLTLYGAAGVPAVEELSNFVTSSYENATGQKVDDDWYRLQSKGVVDQALHFMTNGELNTDFSHRASIGGGWSDTWEKVSDGSLGGNIITLMAGASGKFASDMVNSMSVASTYFKAEQVDIMSPEVWKLVGGDVLKHVNSLKRADAAYWIMKTGMVLDPKDGTPVVKTGEAQAIMSALGIQPAEVNQRWDLIHEKKDRDNFVRSMAAEMSLIRLGVRQAMNDHDDTARLHYNMVGAAFLSAFRADHRLQDEIIKETDKTEQRAGRDAWSKVVQQYEQTFGRKPLGGPQ